MPQVSRDQRNLGRAGAVGKRGIIWIGETHALAYADLGPTGPRPNSIEDNTHLARRETEGRPRQHLGVFGEDAIVQHGNDTTGAQPSDDPAWWASRGKGTRHQHIGVKHCPVYARKGVEMGTLGKFPNPPAMVWNRQNRPAPHATSLNGKWNTIIDPYDIGYVDCRGVSQNALARSLIVRVNNRRRPEGVPAMNTDWWNYGGLTRDVLLVQTPATFIAQYRVGLLGATPVGSMPADARMLGEAPVGVELTVATADRIGEHRAGTGDGRADPRSGAAFGGHAEDQFRIALVSAIRLGCARPRGQRRTRALEIDAGSVRCGLAIIKVGPVIAAASRLATVPRFVEADQEIRLAGT